MAITISDSDRLRALDNRQARIVYLIRHGYSNEEIGQALGGGRLEKALDRKTISDYMAPIYDTLDIHLDNPRAKRKGIVVRYSSLIDHYIPDETVLDYWDQISLPRDVEEGESQRQPDIGKEVKEIDQVAPDIGDTQIRDDEVDSIKLID